MVREAQKASSEPVLWYPAAHRALPDLPTAGRFGLGYPRGAVVSATGGSYGLAELDLARQRGEAFFLIDDHGTVHQAFPLDQWGRHAGAASRELLGIRLEGPGPLKGDGHGTFHTKWGSKVRPADVRVVRGPDGRRIAAAYRRFAPEQEHALCALLLWLKTNNPAVFDLHLVFGRDEVVDGPLFDPGGALRFTMPDLRRHLEERFALLATGVSTRSA